MTGQSKPEPTEEEKKRLREQAVRAFSFSFLFGVSGLCSLLFAESEVIMDTLYAGDLSAGASALAMVSGLSGALEFSLNPTLGRLSDVVGRRPFFVFGPFLVVVGNTLVALQGATNKRLVLANSVVRKAGATFGGSVATMAVLADLCKGREFGEAFSRVFGMAGLGVILGPLSASLLSRFTGGGPRWAYALAAAFACAQIANNVMYIPETLPPPPEGEERRQFKGFVNPFGFVRLFGKSATLSKLVVSAALVSFVEGKNLSDLNQIWFNKDCAMVPSDKEVFSTVWGASTVVSGSMIIPRLLRRLGMEAFTLVTLGLTAAHCMLNAAIPTIAGGSRARLLAATYASLLLLVPGINAGSASALKGWATTHALAAGFGSGEYSGYFSNMRALTTTLGPLIYGNLYARIADAKAKGRKGVPPTGLVWFVAAVLGCVLPVAIYRTVPSEELNAPKEEKKAE